MKIGNLRKVRNHIAEQPARLVKMALWGYPVDDSPKCIGGWADHLRNNKKWSPGDTRQWLGLTYEEENELFFMAGTSWVFFDTKCSFDEKYSHEVRKEMVLRVLDICIREKVVDWRRAIKEVLAERRMAKAARADRRRGGCG